MMSLKGGAASSMLMFILFLSLFIPTLFQQIYFLIIFLFLNTLATHAWYTRFKIGGNDFIKHLPFILVGFIYFVFSYVFGGWYSDYGFDKKYILRQSYFIVFYIIILAGLIHVIFEYRKIFFYQILRKPFILFSLLLCADVLTAFFFGDSSFRDFNGYGYYFNKASYWILPVLIGFYLLSSSDILIRFAYFFGIAAWFLFQQLSGYGVIFNAATGVTYFAILSVYFVLMFKINPMANISFVVFMLLMLFVLIFFGGYYAELFLYEWYDLNTYWRLTSWADNIRSTTNFFGFGAGFGVTYFPLNYEILLDAYRSTYDEKYADPMDKIFIRGQHSSIVNIYFRMGIFGLIAFLYIIFHNCRQFYLNHSNVYARATFFCWLCALVSISVHVGLESPPYLIAFIFTQALFIVACNGICEKNSC